MGARPVRERRFEDNVLFDRSGDTLESARKLLRLRRDGPAAILTYKAPVPGEHAHKVREEEETAVADPDALERILRGLGFSPVYRYQKYRTLYALDDLEICLDETPIGCFVELEGPAASIDRVAAEMGFDRDGYVIESYSELHRKLAAARGEERGDMIFEPGREARR